VHCGVRLLRNGSPLRALARGRMVERRQRLPVNEAQNAIVRAAESSSHATSSRIGTKVLRPVIRVSTRARCGLQRSRRCRRAPSATSALVRASRGTGARDRALWAFVPRRA